MNEIFEILDKKGYPVLYTHSFLRNHNIDVAFVAHYNPELAEIERNQREERIAKAIKDANQLPNYSEKIRGTDSEPFYLRDSYGRIIDPEIGPMLSPEEFAKMWEAVTPKSTEKDFGVKIVYGTGGGEKGNWYKDVWENSSHNPNFINNNSNQHSAESTINKKENMSVEKKQQVHVETFMSKVIDSNRLLNERLRSILSRTREVNDAIYGEQPVEDSDQINGTSIQDSLVYRIENSSIETFSLLSQIEDNFNKIEEFV